MADADTEVPATGTPDASIPRMDWLDYVRLLCALMVMAEHYLLIGPHPLISQGNSGFGALAEAARFAPVALCVFMMISGMMITLVAQRQSASTFAANRFARVYPTFLLCMLTTAMLSPLGPPRFYDSWGQVFANLFIYAPGFGYRYVDAVYWTLVIEVNFYAAMTLLILFGGIRHIQAIIVAWLLLQMANLLIDTQLPLMGKDYYFLSAGAVMALIYQRRNLVLNYLLLGVALMLCLQTTVAYAQAWDYDPVTACAATIGIFAIFLMMRGKAWPLPFAQRIGSMTYPLYLLHFSLGLTIFHWWMTEANKWPLALGTAALLILIAFVVDDVMEFRLRSLWKRLGASTVARPLKWWETRRQTAAAASIAATP